MTCDIVEMGSFASVATNAMFESTLHDIVSEEQGQVEDLPHRSSEK